MAYVADPLLEMRVDLETVTSWLNPARWHSDFETIQPGLALGAELQTPSSRSRSEASGGADPGAQVPGRRARGSLRGDYALAKGYRDVLEKLRAIGLSPVNTAVAAALTNPVGRRLLAGVRVRRARARRISDAISRTTVCA